VGKTFCPPLGRLSVEERTIVMSHSDRVVAESSGHDPSPNIVPPSQVPTSPSSYFVRRKTLHLASSIANLAQPRGASSLRHSLIPQARILLQTRLCPTHITSQSAPPPRELDADSANGFIANCIVARCRGGVQRSFTSCIDPTYRILPHRQTYAAAWLRGFRLS